jgi:hypothetical protein
MEGNMDESISENIGGLLDGLVAAIQEHEEKFIFGHDLEYPVEINGVIFSQFKSMTVIGGTSPGNMVAVRPVSDEYKKKTYLGLYIGDMQHDHLYEYEKETKKLHIIPTGNPAIFVFDLNKIIWGCESWWEPIKDEKHLRQITDNDIQNVWYVKALRAMGSVEENQTKSEPSP